MRNVSLWTARLLCALLLATPTAALAQDDFEDEFEEGDSGGEEESSDSGSTPAAQPASSGSSSSGSSDEFGDDAAPAASSGDDFENESGSAAAAIPGATPPAVREARAELFRTHNTISGAVGGFHIVDAASGAANTFRLQLETDFFFKNGFLNPDDDNGHVGGTLSVSYSIMEFLEVYAGIASTANSNSTENPGLFQTLGDTTLGFKGYYRVMPWLAVGGDLSLVFLNSVGDIGLVGKGTSVGLRANLTADLRHLPSVSIPLIARLNLQHYFDNSYKLVEGVEQARYDALPSDRRVYADEDRQLLTRVERFALSINRVDVFNIGLGFEAPLRVMDNFYIHPLLEWRIGVPVNRQGYDCLYIPNASGDGPADGQDGCLDRQGASSFPQTLTLGARVLPPVSGLSAFIAADIGLTGTSTFVRELAGTAPYNILLGLSYAYDITPIPPDPVVHEVEHRVEVPAALPIKGRVHGLIIEQGAGTTRVAGAVIRFPGREVTAQSTAADGSFTTYDFDPGEVQIEITHPEYNPGNCRGTIPAEGGTIELTCELVALPRVGSVQGSVMSDGGSPIGSVNVSVSGASSRSVTTDGSGAFNIADLPPGNYDVRLEAEGYFPKQGTITISSRSTSSAQFTLVARPDRSSVTVSRREIVIRKQINFATDSDVIDGSSTQLIMEIADALRTHPEIQRVEIQGHTDNVGGADRNLDLSQRRAESVRRALVDAGIDGSRLEAKGYGSTRPLVPNITARNRARNRRVQFIIQTGEN